MHPGIWSEYCYWYVLRLYKNGWTDRHPVWGGDSRNIVLDGVPGSLPHGEGEWVQCKLCRITLASYLSTGNCEILLLNGDN